MRGFRHRVRRVASQASTSAGGRASTSRASVHSCSTSAASTGRSRRRTRSRARSRVPGRPAASARRLSSQSLRFSYGVTSSTNCAPRELPLGTPGGKVPLQHPLGERLSHDGNPIVPAEKLARDRAVGIRRRGRDAVDHGRDEGDVIGDPGDELGFGERENRVAKHHGVGGHVVAGDDGDRTRAHIAALPKPVDEESRGASIGKVSRLRDRERDDGDIGIRDGALVDLHHAVDHGGDVKHRLSNEKSIAKMLGRQRGTPPAPRPRRSPSRPHSRPGCTTPGALARRRRGRGARFAPDASSPCPPKSVLQECEITRRPLLERHSGP